MRKLTKEIMAEIFGVTLFMLSSYLLYKLHQKGIGNMGMDILWMSITVLIISITYEIFTQ